MNLNLYKNKISKKIKKSSLNQKKLIYFCKLNKKTRYKANINSTIAAPTINDIGAISNK